MLLLGKLKYSYQECLGSLVNRTKLTKQEPNARPVI